jgi:Fes/CIP4, and EFC/F-BAR homology domain/SH3 domain
MSYSNGLWDQFEVVTKRLVDGREFSKEAQTWYAKRANLEREYSKKLLALVRSGEVDFGSSQQSWQTMKAETESIAKKHAEIAERILAEVAPPIGQYLKEKGKPRQKLTATGRKLLKDLSSAEAKASSAKSSFESLRKKQDETKEEHERATFNNAQGKMVEKLASKLKADTKRAARADTAYSDAVSKLAGTQARVYDEEMPHVLTDLQRIEEERVAVMQSAALCFADIQSSLSPEITNCGERMKTSAQAVNAKADVEAFVAENRTGASKPPKAAYEAYDPALGRCPSSAPSGAAAGASSSGGGAAPSASQERGPTIDEQQQRQASASSYGNAPAPPVASAPAIAQAPPVLCRCRALYDYEAQDEGELSFYTGDIINVLQQDDSGWWQGELRGRIAVFPSTEWCEIIE